MGSNITIPPDEVIEAPSISNSIGRDFLAIQGGDVQFVLSNRKRQWDDTYAGAYNRSKYDGDLRVSAGFTLPDGTNEFLELFSGKIVDVFMSGVAPRNARIMARNNISEQIGKKILGGPSTGGTPYPYILGAVARARLINLTAASPKIYYLQYKGTINWTPSAPGVLKRRDELSIEHIVSPSSITVSTALKKASFISATAGNQTYFSLVKKKWPATSPPYMLKEILLNELSVPSTHLNATSFDRAAAVGGRLTHTLATTSWGIYFNNVQAIQGIEKLCHAGYFAAFIEGKKFSVVSLGSPPSAAVSLTDADYQEFSVAADKSKIINRARIPYLTYPQNLSRIATKTNATSVASYGIFDLANYYQDFSYTVWDEMNISGVNATVYRQLANSIVKYNAHAKRIFTLSNVYSKGLRLELGDRVRVSNAFLAINQASAVVIGKTVDLNRKRTDLVLLSWP